jgi:hypothetical protein
MQIKTDYLVTLSCRPFSGVPAVTDCSRLRIGTRGEALAWVRRTLVETENWSVNPDPAGLCLFPNDLDQHPLPVAAVEFAVRDPLPGAKVETAIGDGDDDGFGWRPMICLFIVVTQTDTAIEPQRGCQSS